MTDTPQPYSPRYTFQTTEIEDFRLGLGGAVLNGHGSFTESDAPPVPNLIAPQGRLHLALENGTALLHALAQSGLLPTQQIAMAQMMLGMLAQPDGSGDRLTSTLDFGPGTRLLVNGQRLR